MTATVAYGQSSSTCFFVQLFEAGNTNPIFTADNGIGSGTLCPGLSDEQLRPIYTCEALKLKVGTADGIIQCSANNQSYVVVRISDLLTSNLLYTTTINNTLSGGSPSDCEFLVDFNLMGLPTGNYNIEVAYNSTQNTYGVGNITIINNGNPNIITSHTQTNACSGNKEVCFTINSQLPPAMLAQLTLNFGDGSTSTLCTAGLGGSWNCTNPICHTYAVAGNYNVTIVGANVPIPCPMAPYPITVGSPPSVSLSPTNFSGCTAANSFTITATASNGTAPYTYQWGVPAGDNAPFAISPLNTATVTFNPANAVNGSYTLTVTDANGCTATAVFANNAIACCSGFNNLTAVNTTFTDVTTAWLNANFGYVSNNVMQVNALPSQIQVAFNGTLTVNTNFTILNSPNITFGPGAKVVVQPGFTLRIDNSTLRACDNFLWKGIETNSAGSTALGGANQHSVVMVNGASIQDALYGIECSGSGRYSITGCTFDKNYVSVYTRNTTNALSIINGCSFNCSTNVLPSWNSSPITVGTGTKSFSGLFYNTTGSQVNVVGENGVFTSQNNFSGINMGILAINSSVQSYYSAFSFINNYQPSYFGAGWCVFALDANSHPGTPSAFNINLQGRGNGTTAPVLVNFVKNGFYGSNISFVVENYRMENITLLPATPAVNTAIQANACISSPVYIRNNRITNAFYGIRALNNTGANQQIQNNIISVMDVFNDATPPSYTGITVTFINKTDNFFTAIQNNTITNGRFGISVSNAGLGVFSVFYVENNTITMPSTNVYNTGPNADTNPFGNTFFNKDLHGIYLFNCLGAPSGYAITDAFRVSSNTITGPNANHRNYVAYRKAAITLDESQRVVMRCNTMNYTGIGLYVKGNSDHTTMSCNSYGISTTANPGFQYSMLLRRTTVGGDGRMGQIGTATQCFSNSFVPINYAGGFQAYMVNATAPPPVSQTFYDDNNAPGLPLLNITQNGTNNFNFLPVNDATGTPLSCNCSAPAAMMAGGDGSGSMMSIEQAEEIIEGEVAEQYEPVFTDGGLWLKERELYKQLSENPDTIATDIDLEVFYNQKQAESVGQIEELDSKLAYLSDETKAGDTAAYQAKKEELLADNANISGNRAFEVNEKQMNEMYLNRFLAGTDALTTADSALVTSLAYQCPLAAGTAVYKARAVYAMWHAEAMFDDNTLCQGSYKKEKDVTTANEAAIAHQFTLLPNPAKEVAYLYYRMPWEETAVYYLYNTLGEVVATQPIDGSLQLVEIPTYKMSAGIYFVKVQHGDQLLYSAKLSVTK